MQKEALDLAKDLIDARRPVNLETVINAPFLNGLSDDNKFAHYSNSTPWNGRKEREREREKTIQIFIFIYLFLQLR